MAKTFPEGIRVFSPRPGAPDFVKGAIVINKQALISWLNKQEGEEVRLDQLEGNKGLYLAVNDYKPKGKTFDSSNESDLPF